MNSDERWKASVRLMILSIAHTNSYLHAHFGKATADDFFRYYVKQFIKRYGRKYGTTSFLEFVDYLSYIGEILGQAHVIVDIDEINERARLLVVDCMPSEIMEEDRNFVHAGDLCDIWCNNFMVRFAAYAGYECRIKDHEEGCLFEISNPNKIERKSLNNRTSNAIGYDE
ncbi:MAG: hypothetical protein ACFFD4_30425 [Candidatus Odinarchaeota archaeon]